MMPHLKFIPSNTLKEIKIVYPPKDPPKAMAET